MKLATAGPHPPDDPAPGTQEALSGAAVVAAAACAATDVGEVLRERTLPPWTAVLPVSWQLGPPELLSFLLDKETVLSDKVRTRPPHA